MISKVKSHKKTSKSYSYGKDDVALDFTLNIDNSQQLRSLLAILLIAIKDVEADIAKIKN